jgi:predicted membrane channel-forming protein YqfA (hemolysin III family)
MYIVALAWIYVVLMMSITEQTPTAGVMTFLLYGVFPLSIILYLLDMPRRKRRRAAEENLRREVLVNKVAPNEGHGGEEREQ